MSIFLRVVQSSLCSLFVIEFAACIVLGQVCWLSLNCPWSAVVRTSYTDH